VVDTREEEENAEKFRGKGVKIGGSTPVCGEDVWKKERYLDY
jgi:hypothetical protein